MGTLEKITEQILNQIEEIGIIAIWILMITSTKALLHPNSRGFFITVFRLLLCLPVGCLIGGLVNELGYGTWASTGAGVSAAIIFENSSDLVKKHGDRMAIWVDLLFKKLIEKWTK